MSGDALRKVRTGEPLRIPAAAYNAFVDAAIANRASERNAVADPGRDPSQRGSVLVRNDSPDDLPAHHALAITGVLVEPGEDDQERTFQGRTPLTAEVATEDSPPLSFVVSIEPIRAGEIGRCVLHGVAAARIVVDFGCGRNDFIADLRRNGIDGVGVDFAFPEADIKKPMHDTGLVEGVADVVTSFDALEHLLIEDVVPVLTEMKRVARPRAWFCFSICTRPSRITVRGENLHPTVRPLPWWIDVIGRVGVINATKVGGRYITGRFK